MIKLTDPISSLPSRYFTLPEILSTTAQSPGSQTSTFADLLCKANLTETLDKCESITAFIPSDEAFAAMGSCFNGTDMNSTVSLANLLTKHIVNKAVFLSDMKDNSVLRSRQGSKLRISVRDDGYYVNKARIVRSNIILENGVAHVIDKVRTWRVPLRRLMLTSFVL